MSQKPTLRVVTSQDDSDEHDRPKFPARIERLSPHSLAARQWLYGRHRRAGSVSATIGDGGKGKSSLLLAEAVAMATGRDLLGVESSGEINTLYWSGDEDTEEVERRILAICQHYEIDPKKTNGRLFTSSIFDSEIAVADADVMASLDEFVQEHGVAVVIVDPFVSVHRVEENDNSGINASVRPWSKLAAARNISVELCHHTRKPLSGSTAEASVGDARGASSFIDAVRSARVVNPMTESEARQAKVENRSAYFRVTNGKANYAPGSADSDWYRFTSETLPNGMFDEAGDSVGVVETWRFPQAFDNVTPDHMRKVRELAREGNYRVDPQSSDWIGVAVATVLDLDVEIDKGRIKALLRVWFANGVLRTVKRKDAEFKLRPFVEPGEWSEA